MVRIIRGDPNARGWFNCDFEGHGLSSDDGRVVTARIGTPDRSPERLGLGQARVEGGVFRIEFPQGCESDLYKRKLLFVDVDADGSCTPGVDRVYEDYRFLDTDLTFTLIDSVPRPTGPPAPGTSVMSRSRDEATDCQFLNDPWPE